MEKLSLSKLIANDIVNYGMDKTMGFQYVVSLSDFLDEYDDESRDYIKSHIKFEEKSYLMKIKEYKSYLPRIFIFNLIIIAFWIITFFMRDEYRFYIIRGGFICFIIFYAIFWILYYKYNYNKAGFFDDFFIIFNFIKKEWFNENNNDSDNDNIKEKKE